MLSCIEVRVCEGVEEKTQQLGKTSGREIIERYSGEDECESKGGGEPSDSEGWRLITHCGERWRSRRRGYDEWCFEM